jgi:hypothetical protein
VKIIRVENCMTSNMEVCPYCRDMWKVGMRCVHPKPAMQPVNNGTPPDCPLEDAKETDDAM